MRSSLAFTRWLLPAASESELSGPQNTGVSDGHPIAREWDGRCWPMRGMWYAEEGGEPEVT
jgi:hypothetical protein